MAEFDYSTAQAAIQAANQALATAAPAIGNRRQMKRAFNYQKQAMELQSQLWKDNTEWLTEYNSPSNQIARYREAGINPNFVYGNVSGAAQSGMNPTASAPDITRQQAQFMEAMRGISDVVPLFQQALSTQQALQRGEIAQQMDLERLKQMQVQNRYQEEFLDTRNKNAAFDYAFKVGTDAQRKKLSFYQAENAERAYYDALANSEERSQTRDLRYKIMQEQYNDMVSKREFRDQYGFDMDELGPVGSFLFTLFGINKHNPLTGGVTPSIKEVGEKINDVIKENFPEFDEKHTKTTNKVVAKRIKRMRAAGRSDEEIAKFINRQAGIF